jgi:pimeloyl-ACP methyl ester carboxylesterase
MIMSTLDDERAPMAAPRRVLQLMEPLASVEMGALVIANPLLRLVGRGDRAPVLVVPGFSTSDSSTIVLRSQLRAWGYWAHGWQHGRNMGPTRSAFAAARLRLDSLYERHQRPVVVIGQSAGGMIARHLARQVPDRVRMVITLGSPIQMRAGDASSVHVLTRGLERTFDREFHSLAEYERGPLPVPATSVYTRTDGVVRWHACLDVVDATHENVAVRGTHSGLAINPAALLVIADRLHQSPDDWSPFDAPAVLRRLYPPATSWDERPRTSTSARRRAVLATGQAGR